MNANIGKCRRALTESTSPQTLNQITRATKLDGWDSAVALAALVKSGEVIRSNDDGTTLWGLKNRVEVNQQQTIVGQSTPENIIGRA
jgi:hypothetical protein